MKIFNLIFICTILIFGLTPILYGEGIYLYNFLYHHSYDVMTVIEQQYESNRPIIFGVFISLTLSTIYCIIRFIKLVLK